MRSIRRFTASLVVAGLVGSLAFATRLVTYRHRGEARLGAYVDGGVIDLNRAYLLCLRKNEKPRAEAVAATLVPSSMLEFLQGEESSLSAAFDAIRFARGLVRSAEGKARLLDRGVWHALEEVHLMAALPNPPHVLALGLNYRKHAEETGQQLPEYPTLFTKEGAVIGPGETVRIPKAVQQADYEGELGFVIGRRARNVARGKALDYVAGYVVFNDFTARDFQLRVSQWTLGKSVDTFSAMGPFLVLKDEVSDPQRLRITTRLGQEVVQDSNTADMVFTVSDIIAYITQVMTLEPGTVVITGTPSGVGFARKPPRFLRPGDVVTVEIEQLGVLTNPVAQE